jgi:hypothetical protein
MVEDTSLRETKKGSIIVLCYRRTTHLERVIDALAKAEGIENFHAVFVAQDPTPPIIEIIESFPYEKSVIRTDGSAYRSSAQAINGNLYAGLNFVFTKMQFESVIVLEDDIVVSVDALNYFDETVSKFSQVRSFRGVNGFSEVVPLSEDSGAFVKTAFGLGWGWAINSRIFAQISRYWKGTEDDHWDFIFEPYIRTGFVINPLRSRVLNIGFDETATHTSLDSALGEKINKSFSTVQSSQGNFELKSDRDFCWRGENLSYSRLSLGTVFKYRFLFIVYFIFGNSRIYHRVRRFLGTARIR